MLRQSSARNRILLASSVGLIMAMGLGRSGLPEAAIVATEAIRRASQEAVASTFPPVANDPSIDTRARETEQKMTDDERFSLIISLVGPVPSVGVPRDKR